MKKSLIFIFLFLILGNLIMVSATPYTTWRNDCLNSVYGGNSPFQTLSTSQNVNGYDVCQGSKNCVSAWSNEYGPVACESMRATYCCSSGGGSARCGSGTTIATWRNDCETGCYGSKGQVKYGSGNGYDVCGGSTMCLGTWDNLYGSTVSCSSTADAYCCKCIDSSWTPNPASVCSGESFTQTSNCQNTRTATGTKTCSSGYTCQNGACVAESSQTTCTDSDGGIDYYTKGTAQSSTARISDFCLTSTRLQEIFCDSGNVNFTQYDCPNGCSDGVCNPMPLGNDNDIILKLNSSTNANAELWNQSNYNVLIKYSDLFGETYQGENPHECTNNNLILKLSDKTNAVAQFPSCYGGGRSCQGGNKQDCEALLGCTFKNYFFWHTCDGVPLPCDAYDNNQTRCESQHCSWTDNYPDNVCYGDLECEITQGDCNEGDTCIVKVSGKTNAQLETCDNSNYQYSICCHKKSNVNCQSYTNKDDCWNASDDCTWTPLFNEQTGEEIKTNQQGGGCCPKNKPVWNGRDCIEGEDNELCTIPITEFLNQRKKIPQGPSGPIREDPDNPSRFEYCEQITKGMNYGIWKDVIVY